MWMKELDFRSSSACGGLCWSLINTRLWGKRAQREGLKPETPSITPTPDGTGIKASLGIGAGVRKKNKVTFIIFLPLILRNLCFKWTRLRTLNRIGNVLRGNMEEKENTKKNRKLEPNGPEFYTQCFFYGNYP